MRNNVQKIQLNANQLKMIAIIAMLFDHFMALFADHGTMTGIVFRIPGRIVAPIMFFHSGGILLYIKPRKICASAVSVCADFSYSICFMLQVQFLPGYQRYLGINAGINRLDCRERKKTSPGC